MRDESGIQLGPHMRMHGKSLPPMKAHARPTNLPLEKTIRDLRLTLNLMQ